MTRPPSRFLSSDRGLYTMLVLATLFSTAILALVWSLFGALAVLVPIGCVGLGVAWVGSLMHAAPVSRADDTGPPRDGEP